MRRKIKYSIGSSSLLAACVKILTSPMFWSNSIKIFFVLVALACQSCGYWRGQTNATPAPTAFAVEELRSAVPFSTKEPDVYQTEIVVTGADGFEEKTFAAKNGANRLLILDFQGRAETALLQLGANQTLTIARRLKIYTEDKHQSAAAKSSPLNDFLTAELLNRKTGATFEALGAENDFVKYRVNMEDAQHSEIIVYVNAQINLPVRQEFYSVSGEQKIPALIVELRNFNLQTEPNFFEVPVDYRKVSPEEFRAALRRERIK